MPYVKLNKDTKTGKGFITHDDQLNLNFAMTGDIVLVTGHGIDPWTTRVKGAIIADDVALKELRAKKLIAVNSEIERLESEVVRLSATKINIESAIAAESK